MLTARLSTTPTWVWGLHNLGTEVAGKAAWVGKGVLCGMSLDQWECQGWNFRQQLKQVSLPLCLPLGVFGLTLGLVTQILCLILCLVGILLALLLHVIKGILTARDISKSLLHIRTQMDPALARCPQATGPSRPAAAMPHYTHSILTATTAISKVYGQLA